MSENGSRGSFSASAKSDRRLDFRRAPRFHLVSSRRHKPSQHLLRDIDPRGVPRDGHPVASTGEANPQGLLDPDQVPVVIPEQQGQQGVVVELEGDGLSARCGGGGRCRGDGEVCQAIRLSWTRVPASEFGWAATIRTNDSVPIRSAFPDRWTG